MHHLGSAALQQMIESVHPLKRGFDNAFPGLRPVILESLGFGNNAFQGQSELFSLTHQMLVTQDDYVVLGNIGKIIERY